MTDPRLLLTNRERVGLGCLLLVVVGLMAVLGLAGCASSRPAPPPELVEVPVYTPPQPLPIPAPPAWRTPSADPEDPEAYLEALVSDLLEAWRYAVELRQVLEAFNEAAAADE